MDAHLLLRSTLLVQAAFMFAPAVFVQSMGNCDVEVQLHLRIAGQKGTEIGHEWITREGFACPDLRPYHDIIHYIA